ncbi:unnamed protein product [Cunninghamella blakesleeana]
MTNIIELPLEIFHSISQHLDIKTIYTLCLINRAHYHYYYPFLFQIVNINSGYQLRSFIKSLKNKKWKSRILGENTRTLCFNDTEMSFEELKFIQSQCSHVKNLTMDNGTWHYMYEKALYHSKDRLDHDIFYEMLIQLLQKYSQLSMLSLGLYLGMPNASTFQHVFECLPHLRDLSLDNINLMEMTDFEIIHQCCPHLETLSFDGFCLLRKKATPPIIPNTTLRSLKIKFSSGWSVYWDWLSYIGIKYTQLEQLICICPTTMGVRNLAESASEMRESCDIFAKNHARHLKRLDLVNLNLDISFYNALSTYASSHHHHQQHHSLMINDSNQLITKSKETKETKETKESEPEPSVAIKELRVTKASSDDSIAKFEAIIDYIHHTIERLTIFSPTVEPNTFEIYHLLQKCIHLTDLTFHMPYQQRFFSDFDIDILLNNCPQLTRLCILHANLKTMKSITSSTTSTSASETSSKLKKKVMKDHPLKELILKQSNIRNQVLSSCFNLCHLHTLHIKDCSIVYPSKYYDDNYYLKIDINLVPILLQDRSHHLPMSIFINSLEFTDHQGIKSPTLRQIIIDENELNHQQSWIMGVSNTKWKKSVTLNPRRSDRLKAKKDFHDSFTNNSVQITIKCQSVKTLFINDQQLI